MIDLRSDTVTQPTPAMRAAMMAAPLGDDVFRDDPTVLELEATAARMLGKEAGLYVPTGTMANQLALRVHCRHGDEVVAHRRCHIFNYETGAAAALAGVQLRTIDSDDGNMTPEAVAAQLRISDDTHVANTALLAFENTHNACGGLVLDQALVEASVACAAAQGVPAHLDGARLANAAVASGSTLAALAAPFQTVSLCLSKGLGAPVGSVLCGDRRRITLALRYRKMYGGGMRQAGVIAAAGLHALQHHVERLADDHARTQHLAEALGRHAAVQVEQPQTNLLFFNLAPDYPVSDVDFEARLSAAGVLVHGGNRRFRAVLHLDVDDAALEQAISAFDALF
jgi:threonine aldolase